MCSGPSFFSCPNPRSIRTELRTKLALTPQNRNIVVQLESSVLFLHPPYRWQVHSLGLLGISGLIGTFFAIFVGGKLIDLIANYMTKRNSGRREPEYRLPATIIPAVIGPMGILLFGLCAADKKPWIGAAFGYGMQGFGLTAVSNIMATYAVDSYHSVSSLYLFL